METAVRAGPVSVVRFVDVTHDSGLDFKQSDGGNGTKTYFIQQVAAGACVLDANADGAPDIYFPAPKPLAGCKFDQPLKQRLYLNDGKGRFTLSQKAFGSSETDYGIAAAAGDYDNDGHVDLYVACYGKNTLYHNRGDGTFEDVTKRAGVGVGGFSTGAVWFDYDGDGRLDLYVLRYCEWTIETNIPCPGPHGERAGCDPTTYPPARHVLLHNIGRGRFKDATSTALPDLPPGRGLAAAAADFDGDGRLDVFVANDLGPNFLLHNRGNGVFQDVAMQMGSALGVTGLAQANMGVAVGDFDNSGHLSAAVTTFENEPRTLYRNSGQGFTDVSAECGLAMPTMPYLAFGTGFFDSRNAGSLDLLFANGHVTSFTRSRDPDKGFRQRNQLFLNDGEGNFVESRGSLPADDIRVHRGVSFASFRNNGKLDVLVTASDDRPTLLRNETQTGNWLLLSLTDRHGCATPIGTRCIATVKGRKRTRVVLGGGSYGGDSDTRVHIGLGDANLAEEIEIRWLSGKVQTLKNVAANQILNVKEPR